MPQTTHSTLGLSSHWLALKSVSFFCLVTALTFPLPASSRELEEGVTPIRKSDWRPSDRIAWLRRASNASGIFQPFDINAGRGFVNAAIYNVREGLAGEYETVSQRHAFYDVFSYSLRVAEDIPESLRTINFFSAAADVTSPYGVGIVDEIDLLKKQANLSPQTERLIIDINTILLKKNFQVIHALLYDWKEPRDPNLPDPREAISTMDFDLRMVSFEQNAVEDFIQRNPSIVIPSASGEFGQRHPFWETSPMPLILQAAPLSKRKQLLDEWLPAIGIQSFDFFNKGHRIALGEAYIFLLTRCSQSDYTRYKRTGISTCLKSRVEPPPSNNDVFWDGAAWGRHFVPTLPLKYDSPF